MKKIIIVALSLFLFIQYSRAQGDSTKGKVTTKVSMNYNSYLNYYGRTDTLKSSGVFPMLEVWYGSKFYFNAAPILVNNRIQKFDYAGTVVTAGFQSLTDKWLTHLYVTKPFYENDVELVQAALKAQTGVGVSYLNKVLNVTVGGDAKFSDATDFGAMTGIDHIVSIENKDNSLLVFDPSFYMYAGSQRFSHTYLVKKDNLFPLPIGGGEEAVEESRNKFNILAYEFSVPIIYAKGKMQIIANPAYVMPQNLLTVEDKPELSETGKNSLYVTFTAKYIF